IGDREPTHRNADALLDAEVGKEAFSRPAQLAPIHSPNPIAWQTPGEYVLSDRQVGKQIRMLVDDGDAQVTRRGRPSEHELMAVQLHMTGIRSVDAGQDFHKGALARSVLADKRVDLVGEAVEVNIG